MKISCFSLDVSIQKDYPLIERDKKTVLSLKCGKWWSVYNPILIDADPFLFVYNGRLFLFYEELVFRRSNGVIRMVSTNDLQNWTKPVTVTHEPNVHFSFPYVFEEGDTVYMLPECGCTHTVSLYKADNKELTSFSKYKTLVQREKGKEEVMYDYNDSCFLKNDGMYYLFTTVVRPQEINELQLRLSDSLLGPYKKHPISPIMIDNKFGRCAGSIIQKDGHFYRVAQDCSISYGENVHLLHIDEITQTTYKEHIVVENMLPTDAILYKNGGHQINFVSYKDMIIVATDRREWHRFIIPRILKKIRKMMHISNN